MPSPIRSLCALRSETVPNGHFAPAVEAMKWPKLNLFSRGWIEHSFKTLVDRKIREQRREERRLVEQRTTKHRLQARKSCIADARNYRVARPLPVLAAAFGWKH